MILTKSEITDMLSNHVCKIHFVKADGSERFMLGTLLDTYIQVESAGKSKPNEEVVTVWDCEKDSWRAFRIDRLISIEKADLGDLIGLANRSDKEPV